MDDDYIACLEDTLQTYERDYDAAQPVVCLDEKPITLHAEVRPGTANVFCAVEPKAGCHFTFPTTNRAGYQFAQVMFRLAIAYREAKTIHLIMDNLSTHTRKSLTDFYGESVGAESWNRFTIHYTPKHGSWLDLAESELGVLSSQCLDRRIPDKQTLIEEIAAWEHDRNANHTKANWHFTTPNARIKLKHLYPSI